MLGKEVKSIGEKAFALCHALKSIEMNDGLEAVGAYAFVGSPIEELIFPDSVTELPANAILGDAYFMYSDTKLRGSLRKVHWPAGVTAVPEGQFGEVYDNGHYYYFSSLEEVEIPEGVTGLGARAFSGCSSLKRLHIPTTIKSIDPDYFSSHSHLGFYRYAAIPS